MATDTAERRASHIRGITVTMLSSIAGMAAAVASQAIVVTPDVDPATAAGSNVALYIVVAAIIVQFPLLKVIGIDIDDFSTKDYLYVAFMTFSLWFVSWGVLLTANTPI